MEIEEAQGLVDAINRVEHAIGLCFYKVDASYNMVDAVNALANVLENNLWSSDVETKNVVDALIGIGDSIEHLAVAIESKK